MKQYQLSSWFWRGLFGFLIGCVLLSFIRMQIDKVNIFNSGLTLYQQFTAYLALPLFGLHGLDGLAENFLPNIPFRAAFLYLIDVTLPSVELLFYPFVFGATFSLAGLQQTRRVIMVEAVLAVFVLVCFGLFPLMMWMWI